MEDLRLIGEKRRKLGITQHALAKAAGVSQSLVAKIESGRVDAAYSKVRAIMWALEREVLSKEKCAKDIMHTGIQAVSSSEKLHSAAAKMRKLSISQLPVVDGKRVVGSLTEAAILAHFSSDPKKIANLLVSEVMDQPFPTALLATPISAIAALLRHYPAVLVMDRGELAGIITKADLLATI